MALYFNDPFLTEMERTMNRVMDRTFGSFGFPRDPITGMTMPLLEPPSPAAARDSSRHGVRHGHGPGALMAVPAPAGLGLFPAMQHMPMDIVETDKAYEVHADAPGMTPEEVKVELHEGVLTVSGNRKVAREDNDEKGKVWRSERSSYSFSRAFTLPDNANPDAVSASLDKGVLTVTLAKKEAPPEAPKTQPKRIAVAGPAAASAPA